MGRRVRLVVVCEDLLQETFMRAFLLRCGLRRQDLTFRKPKPGKGDAKQGVCAHLCNELPAIRRYRGEGRGLVYVIDADNLSVAKRRQMVEQQLRSCDVEPPQADEHVFRVIPKWEIENWIAYLDGEDVNEASNRYNKYQKRESAIYPLVGHLADMCDRQELPGAPPSLALACKDYPRFRDWIKDH